MAVAATVVFRVVTETAAVAAVNAVKARRETEGLIITEVQYKLVN